MRTWRELAISAPVRTPFIRFCRLATRVLLPPRSGHPWVGWSEIRTEGHEGNEEGVRMATHSWTVSSLKRRIARRRAECRRFGQAFGSSASLPSCSSVHNLFAPVIGGNDTSPRVDPRARRLVDPWGTAKSRRPPHALSAAQGWAVINFPISMQTLRAAEHPRSHAPARERTSCRSAAFSRLIREVTPDLFPDD
jgi:hypothetical protein